MSGERPSTARPDLQRNPQTPAPAPGTFDVVAIGASAGGLSACRALLQRLPADTGMAFVVVLHLEPDHQSLMAELLGEYTAMPVVQAAEAMALEPDHVYVIAPGTELSVADGLLQVRKPSERHGARLPFDIFLHALAAQYGSRAVAVVLSGSGSDGSLGLQSVHRAGGLVLAQAPEDAEFDGMPHSAIATGAVDRALSLRELSEALAQHVHRRAEPTDAAPDAPDVRVDDHGTPAVHGPLSNVQDRLPAIIELMRSRTPHDFGDYKSGTLRRRIERRMGLAAIALDHADDYLELLRRDAAELDLLAKDLLINVTAFFRDPDVFERLARDVIPDLIRSRPADSPLRVWVAGCSTGEEAYSLAILFLEQAPEGAHPTALKVFASDVDADAVASAREGLYPASIAGEITPARLARFFVKDGPGYRVAPQLRSTVVFTVQDVLADPPFSRIDLVSCRNLLIYLGPAGQAKAISLFHFALRDGGLLLLGSAEAIGDVDGRFEVVSKSERLFRRIGRTRAIQIGSGEAPYLLRQRAEVGISGRTTLADLCRRRVIENYAPAAVLIDRKYQTLYSLGPTERYLRVPAGYPTHDLIGMMPPGAAGRLTEAVGQALHDNTRVAVAGGRTTVAGVETTFTIEVQPVPNDGDTLLLICFLDDLRAAERPVRTVPPQEISRVVELEQDLAATRKELQEAVRNLELSSDEQMAINEEALSLNEEFQSTNEELLTSKEELQSLNEELTALNGQLQESLERQRTTSNDLQNILYSTDVATIFLDPALAIRFFTPATRALFNVIPGDVGRPLADLSSLSHDGRLLDDATEVLKTLTPIEREIETRAGKWFFRRVLPYRTLDGAVQGVVITFSDISERHQTALALEAAKRQAEVATIAKSRFLSAASHDLRQPLQTLSLLQGLLARVVTGDKAEMLVSRFDEALNSMTGMIDGLLDMNQIETGTVSIEIVSFAVDSMLERLASEYTYQAQSKGLAIRVVRSRLTIDSDPRLLEQMVRNILANALKYTTHGKILLGCRRRGANAEIEVVDTGIGIPESEFRAIFEEHHQINPGRERARGLGLGLSIVQRLSELLHHPVDVRSRLGHGTCFGISVPRHDPAAAPTPPPPPEHPPGPPAVDGADGLLVVEESSEVRDLLRQVLESEGHHVATAADGSAAIELLRSGAIRPRLILTDYNLDGGHNGLEVAAKLRAVADHPIPVVVLTSDTSAATLRHIALENCVPLDKPVRPAAMTAVIERLLAARPAPPHPHLAEAVVGRPAPHVFIVDDDDGVRAALRSVLEAEGATVEDFATGEAFLGAYHADREACLLIDAYLPGMSGIELLERLKAVGHALPSIMITGNSDVPMAVAAMKAGASDFIEKPVGHAELLASVERALEQARDVSKRAEWHQFAADHVAILTPRQRQIMEMVLAGHPSKNIAADLGISQRTVENHRASIMKKTGSKSLPALARLALAAGD